MTSPTIRRVATTCVALLASGCIPLGRHATYRRDQVQSKIRPDRLVGSGGSTCTVSSREFEKVLIGQRRRCVWTEMQPSVPTPRLP